MSRPFVVAVAGGTGSGKTTIARKLVAGLSEQSVTLLQYDSYYRSRIDLSPQERDALNFDHPSALDCDLLELHLNTLLAGQPAEIPLYDYSTHLRRPESRRVLPAPIVIVEGILLLAEARLRPLFDLKVFVDTDADIRLLRRIERDLAERARTFDQVKEQYQATVRPMHLQFVEPSKRYADVIIPEGGHNEVALDLISALLHSRVAASPEDTLTPGAGELAP